MLMDKTAGWLDRKVGEIRTFTQPMSSSGVFCISLDFEKFWGVQDVAEYQRIEMNFLKIEDVVFRVLDQFEKSDMHATWAFVGLLAFESKEELLERTSGFQIPYENHNFSPYRLTADGLRGINPRTLLARKELQAIKSCPGQELGSHTFSHYYALESGPTVEDFRRDNEWMMDVARGLDITLRSIVFPRNQIREDCLDICKSLGFTAFRGNQENKLWMNSRFEEETVARRARRWASAYFKENHTKFRTIAELETVKGMLNIPASRFLRPPGKNPFLEKRKIKIVMDEMSNAARSGAVYHLWWHPHNFTGHPEESFGQLSEIILHYKKLQDQFGFTSRNMSEIGKNE